jgi:hypothetical protein
MSEYDEIRQQYRPEHIKVLLIAESPPPPPEFGGSRHFYRADPPRPDDRLFNNTMRALYPETAELSDQELQQQKEQWLRRFQADGWFMIESLERSLAHKVTKKERQVFIKEHLDRLIERVSGLADPDTKLILIKSNVFDVAAEPLRAAGFTVLNQKLLDYPGHFNQKAYRDKLSAMAALLV